MKEVLENVNNYVVIIDENEIIKFCNEKFAKKINYSKDELLEGKITEKLLYKNHFFYNIKNSFKILNESDNIYSFKNKNGNINSFIGKPRNCCPNYKFCISNSLNHFTIMILPQIPI